MKLLITGAKGQLGTAVEELFCADNEVIALDKDGLDVTNRAEVFRVLEIEKPNVIINCAAYNAVEKAGEEIELAYQLNALAPYYLAEASSWVGARLVHVSTDYVFGDQKTRYAETDAPTPLNVYGASKLAGEQLVLLSDPRHIVVRTSWLFGKSRDIGSHNFVTTMLSKGRSQTEVRVVADQMGVPTYAPDLASKIKELLEKNVLGGIYHVTNSGSCSRFEFVQEIYRVSGLSTVVSPISTTESGSRIRRPVSTILENKRILAMGIAPLCSWQDALAEYLNNNFSSMQFYDQRFHEDARRRGFYDIIPGLAGDMNFTHMNAGIISGLHMHPKHTDYFVVAKGALLFRLIYSDGRPEEKIVVSEHTHKTLLIPPGVWHGYKSLEPSVVLFYTDHKFDPTDELRRETTPEEWQIEIK